MSSEIVHVLVFLLPGFLTAAIFHSLTPHRKPEAFEHVISALVFTIYYHRDIISIGVHSIFYKYGSQAAIMLYFKQNYNLYGRLLEYPKDPKNGYFHVSEAVRVTNEGEPIPLEIDADAVLVPAAEVKMLALAPMIERGKETEEKS